MLVFLVSQVSGAPTPTFDGSPAMLLEPSYRPLPTPLGSARMDVVQSSIVPTQYVYDFVTAVVATLLCGYALQVARRVYAARRLYRSITRSCTCCSEAPAFQFKPCTRVPLSPPPPSPPPMAPNIELECDECLPEPSLAAEVERNLIEDLPYVSRCSFVHNRYAGCLAANQSRSLHCRSRQRHGRRLLQKQMWQFPCQLR